jgi:uncharacterized protein YbjT (DUF2867 family)
MKLLVIGANGKIGRKLVEACVSKEIPVRAMVRRAEQVAEFEQLGAEAVQGDLEGDFASAFQGCTTVVFTAGSGSATGADKTLLVDLFGSVRAVEAAERSGINYFIMVSSLKSDDPLRGPEKIRHYLIARHMADDRLLRSSMPHCVLRPARLVDDPASGRVTSKYDPSDANNRATTISRGNVVEAILDVLARPLPTRTIVNLLDGETPIQRLLDGYGRN